MMYNAVNNQTPDYLSSRFTPRHEVLSYSLRNAECKLSIPQPRTNYSKRSFSYSGAVLWNSSPKEIKQSNSQSDYKMKLKHHNFHPVILGKCTRHPCKAGFLFVLKVVSLLVSIGSVFTFLMIVILHLNGNTVSK